MPTAPVPPAHGFRGPTVQKLVGISYRQLDYWARTGLVTPSVRAAEGSGSQRLYSFADIVELRVIKRLLDAGISLRRIREALTYLRAQPEAGEHGGSALDGVTLISDSKRIYACRSGEEVIDVLSNGQAVFGIAIGRVIEDTQGDVAHLPVEDLPVEDRPESAAKVRPLRGTDRPAAQA